MRHRRVLAIAVLVARRRISGPPRSPLGRASAPPNALSTPSLTYTTKASGSTTTLAVRPSTATEAHAARSRSPAIGASRA